MGVPKLFRFLAERYPCLVENITKDQILDFDNLYLDMNGIIHQSSHPNNGDTDFIISEEDILKNIFHYIEVLFNIINPKKLLFLAVDGVAPRAKMNQQRNRRFKTAKDTERKNKSLEAKGLLVEGNSFDSNCISPGTVFMDRLHHMLIYFITNKVSTDSTWQNCKVILSGHQTPGEGEHKIMDYLRYLKTRPDYDPNLKHCFFGSDADLMMLGLCTHEQNFYVLREKFEFGKKDKGISIDKINYQLLHLPFLRDYLELEFEDLKCKLPFEFRLENIIDDWVFMTFLLGNDFVPHLPDLHIKFMALPILYETYKEVLPTLDGYLNENGLLNLPRFQAFIEKLSVHDVKTFQKVFDDLKYLEGKCGGKLTLEKYDMEEADDEDEVVETELEDVATKQQPSRFKRELNDLIMATNDLFAGEEYDEDDCDTFLSEFNQTKKNYYTNKMGLSEVTDDTLNVLVDDYIHALQWILYYYYRGCQSWTWFYPHHYSPYISDIVEFKERSIDFVVGEPFLPFQQLMAILPARCKDLVPECYRHLMTSPDSPIIDFYPPTFEIDVLPHQMEWEGVVLIPFIDQERLLSAMAGYEDQLTESERRRNRHGFVSVFTYTEKNLGVFTEVEEEYFPQIKENHAVRLDLEPEAFLVDVSDMKFGPSLSGSGCPTLKNISFTSGLKKCNIAVFQVETPNPSMTLSVVRTDRPPLKTLAEDILGKVVQVNWPFLADAKVVAVADDSTSFKLTQDGRTEEQAVDATGKSAWCAAINSHEEEYMRRRAIDIGKTDVLAYVRNLEGSMYVVDEKRISYEEFWSSKLTTWPMQTIVREKRDRRKMTGPEALTEAFPIGSTVFMLGQPHFGSMGRVLDNSEILKTGRLNVALETLNDLTVNLNKEDISHEEYVRCKTMAKNIGISSSLVSRLTGFILVDETESATPADSSRSKVNVGLTMKVNSRNLELPGYTKKDGDVWCYSARAGRVIAEYVQKFPQVVEKLAQTAVDRSYTKESLFPGPEGSQQMQEVVDWIEKQEYRRTEFISCGSHALDRDATLLLEEEMKKSRRTGTVKTIKVKPSLLYKSDLIKGNLSPVKSTKNSIADKVVSIRSSHTVPTGLRGIIIGVNKGEREDDQTYYVLFEKPFPGGLAYNTLEPRVFKMDEWNFLNLSSASRTTKNVKVVPGKVQILRPTGHEQRPPSAFVQWGPNPRNQVPQVVQQQQQQQQRTTAEQSNSLNEQFRRMWSNQQKAQMKPQEETMALKKLLRIGDETEKKDNEQQQPTIEDPVKMFFQKMNAQTKSEANPRKDGPEVFQPKKQITKDYVTQLCDYYCRQKLPPPKFEVKNKDGQVVVHVFCKDGTICVGDPCGDEETALKSAALKKLAFLCVPPHNQDDQENNKSTSRNQVKLMNALLRQDEKSRKPVMTGEDRSQPLSGKNIYIADNLRLAPEKLPYPPQRWVAGRHRPPNASASTYLSGAKQGNSQQVGPRGSQKKWREPAEGKPQVDGGKPGTSVSKSNESALGFVPLQVITGKRTFKPIVTTQTKTPSATVDLQKKAQIIGAIVSQSESSPKSRPKRQRARAPRIAANLNLDLNR